MEDQIPSGNLAGLKGLGMDAPDDAVLRLAQLTLSPNLLLPIPTSHTSFYQVEDQISSGDLASLKDVGMDAPDDAVLRLAQLALRCIVERTAGRPNMTGVANELQGIRHEVVGKEKLGAAIKVDALAQELRTGTSFPNDLAEELQVIKSMDEETANTGLQGIEYSSFGSGRTA
ncbi:unnamed protein product [Closterium sp. Yama58-4]|nr:unnamed protein product [Closterium sp. Yama58-4]